MTVFCLRQHQQAGWRTRARQGSSSPRTPRKPGSRRTIPKALPSSMRGLEMNRLGRRTAYATLVILVLAIIW